MTPTNYASPTANGITALATANTSFITLSKVEFTNLLNEANNLNSVKLKLRLMYNQVDQVLSMDQLIDDLDFYLPNLKIMYDNIPIKVV
jgi:hypothetical protein